MIRKSLTSLTILNSNSNSFLFLLLKNKLSSFSMVCSCCKGIVQTKHNKRTCPFRSGPCVVIASPNKKVRKPFENLASCMNIFKEPKSFYTAPKVRKPFENLASCMNIFKEPKSFYTAPKVVVQPVSETPPPPAWLGISSYNPPPAPRGVWVGRTRRTRFSGPGLAAGL